MRSRDLVVRQDPQRLVFGERISAVPLLDRQRIGGNLAERLAKEGETVNDLWQDARGHEDQPFL